MQTDPKLLREIISACIEQRPEPVWYDTLQTLLWCHAEQEIRDHVRMLERGGYVQVEEDRIGAMVSIDGTGADAIASVNLVDLEMARHLLASLEPAPEPETEPTIGYQIPRDSPTDSPSMQWIHKPHGTSEKWINLPKDRAPKFFEIAADMKQLAVDLIAKLRAIRGRPLPPGRAISLIILQALAAEYVLKGLSVQEKGGHLQIHNLHKLYQALQPETQARIVELGRARAGVDMPEFLKDHRNDFVDWRYVLEGGDRETNPFDSDKALEALIAASNP